MDKEMTLEDEVGYLNDEELVQRINELCIEIYGEEYFEIFGFEEYTREQRLYQIRYLQRKSDILVKDLSSDRDGYNFLDLWREYWNTRVVLNADACDIYGFVALSQLFNHVRVERGVKDDLRLHACVIMPSGMAKSEFNDILAEFADIAGKSYYSVGVFKINKLIGEINKKIVSNNMRINAFSKKDRGWVDPVEPGILASYDYVVFDEGETVLDHKKIRIQALLDKTMNRIGSKGNMITSTDNRIHSNPACSLVITSYHLDTYTHLFKKGLFPRMIVYVEPEDPIKRTKTSEYIVSAIPSFVDDISEAEKQRKDKENLQNKLRKKLKEEVENLQNMHKDTETIYMRAGVDEIINDYIVELRNIVPGLNPEQIEAWESMVSRISVNFIKVAALFAMMNYRNYIDREDAHNAARLLFPAMRSVAFYIISNNTGRNEKLNRLVMRLRREFIGMRYTKEEWQKVFFKSFGAGESSSEKLFALLIKSGKMRVLKNKDEGTTVYMLS